MLSLFIQWSQASDILRLFLSLNSWISETSRSFDSTSEISLVFSTVIFICLLNCCNNFLKGLQLWSPLTVIYFTLQATQSHPLVWNAWMISFCLQDKNLNFLVWLFEVLAQSLSHRKSCHPSSSVNLIKITTLNCAKLSVPFYTSFFLKLFLLSQLLSPCITSSLSVWKNSWNFSKLVYILPLEWTLVQTEESFSLLGFHIAFLHESLF